MYKSLFYRVAMGIQGQTRFYIANFTGLEALRDVAENAERYNYAWLYTYQVRAYREQLTVSGHVEISRSEYEALQRPKVGENA